MCPVNEDRKKKHRTWTLLKTQTCLWDKQVEVCRRQLVLSTHCWPCTQETYEHRGSRSETRQWGVAKARAWEKHLLRKQKGTKNWILGTTGLMEFMNSEKPTEVTKE